MNINKLRKDFPILSTRRNGQQLIYCDNAATVQKPYAVVKAMSDFYLYEYAPVHKGIYYLAEQATERYEHSRTIVAEFINVHPQEVIFTSGATDSINFIAHSWGLKHINKNDIIILTELEHHANILPWIKIARAQGAIIKYIPVNPDGTLDYQKYLQLLDTSINTNTSTSTQSKSTIKLVAVSATSNVFGNDTDIEFIIKHAHERGSRVLVDAAQSIAHKKLDVKKLNADFVVFSAHKIMGPTGLGVAFIKEELHDLMEPYKVGGGMVFDFSSDNQIIWHKAPHKFEAGTPPIAQAIGLAEACNYYNNYINYNDLQNHEALLCARLIEGIYDISGITIWGSIDQLKKSGHLITLSYDKAHPHDIAAYFDLYNICVRAGHHCAQPLHQKLGLQSSLRISFYCYNTLDEVDKIVKTLRNFTQVF